MASPKFVKRARSGSKTGSAERAAPITDWLHFIRPHLEVYRRLPWSKPREFIDKLARDEGQSVNTLRRYIAAAQFLESFGITQFPEGIERVPVASVEAIGRISKKDPASGRALLADLLSGVGTIRGLKKQLKAMPKRATASRSARTTTPVSQSQFVQDVKHLLAHAPRNWMPPDLRWFPFDDWTGPATMFARQAWPHAFVPLVGGHAVVAFDEATLAWATSPALVTQAFIRNIAAATAVFDLVLVYCNALQPDVERVVAAMRQDCGSRIQVFKGLLDLPVD